MKVQESLATVASYARLVMVQAINQEFQIMSANKTSVLRRCPDCGKIISKDDVDSDALHWIDIGDDETHNYTPLCRRCTKKGQN